VSKVKSNDIDIVITWVDGNDTEWIKEKNVCLKKETSEIEIDISVNRYRNWDNLQYIFRGIEKFMPWVRKVHLVTNGQKPSWLNINNEKLNLVFHSDFIPSECLPTFNSNSIEANIHKIHELTEQFIYFNDDMFVANHMKPEEFFKNGLPCDTGGLQWVHSQDCCDVFWHKMLNETGIINKHFKKKDIITKKMLSIRNGVIPLIFTLTIAFLSKNDIPGIKLIHFPTPFLKSTFSEVWQAEPEIYKTTSSTKFRSQNSMGALLVRKWQIASGKFVPKNWSKFSRYYDSFPEQTDKLCSEIIRQKYKFFCINDKIIECDFQELKKQINSSFQLILPDKSKFEL
jgi:hypothetical protein